jgi:hypothetical protein
LGGFALIQSAKIRPIRVIRVPFQLSERFAVSHIQQGAARQEMSDAQRVAVAYSRLYELLRDLFLCGLTADLLTQAATIDELRVTLPPVFDADENAALFQSTFGFNVFPYQSLFLDPAFLLGGAESAAIRQFYAAAGYAPTPARANRITSATNWGCWRICAARRRTRWPMTSPAPWRRRGHCSSAFSTSICSGGCPASLRPCSASPRPSTPPWPM